MLDQVCDLNLYSYPFRRLAPTKLGEKITRDLESDIQLIGINVDVKSHLTLRLDMPLPDASLLPNDPVSARPLSPIFLPLDPPRKPVFGLDLDQLFERDGLVVPIIVSQCIMAVDLFGLEVEGVYRLSGTQSHVNKMRAMFDNGISGTLT